MIEIPASAGGTYCIDATEVSQAQYFEFMEVFVLSPRNPALVDPDKAATLPRAPGCETDYLLGPDPLSDYVCNNVPFAYDYDEKHPDYPVACVNWCNAYAYCAWAGKRLCGRIGGGAVPPDELADAAASQWFNACSQGGKTRYSYGDSYDPAACAPAICAACGAPEDNPDSVIATVDEPTDCRGNIVPFDKVTNLSGNVAEWTENCEIGGGGLRLCAIQAALVGTTASPAERHQCSSSLSTNQYSRVPFVGFRCCLD